MPRPQSRLDYDPLAGQYDQRYRANPLLGVAQTLANLARRLKARRILEVGCGTGRWLAGLLEASSDMQCFGLDYSTGMLTQAQQRSLAIHLTRGTAGRLPFADQSFDLVFCVNALHHFDEPEQFIQQSRRMLRAGGVLAIVGQVPHDHRNQWYVYDYFEGTREKDLQRFPTWGQVADWMIAAGFEQIHWQPIEQILADRIGQTVLTDPFLQKEAVSQLALLSQAEYAAGLEKIGTDLQKAEQRGQNITFSTQLRLDLLSGTTSMEAP